jgi:GT2 family glycosyltransferase
MRPIVSNALLRVSGVIVSYNGGTKVLRCIESLKRQTSPFHEIIVVDNASSDGSPDAIRDTHPDVRLVRLPENRGPSVSRNASLSVATGELVFWIDNDIYADPDCLARMLVAVRVEPAELVVPRIMLIPEDDIVQADGGEAHFIGTLTLRNGFTPLQQAGDGARARIGASPSGCLLMNREIARAIGGFDESYFFYFEDYEFSLRTRILGHRILCEPAAIVRHDRGTGNPTLAFRGSGAYPRERAYLLMRNRLRTILTHYSRRTLLVLAPVLLLYELATLALSISRGWAGAWLRALGWIAANRGAVCDRRRWIQSRRRTADRDILSGGPLPLAPGLLQSSVLHRIVDAFSALLNGYWQLTRRFI